MDTYTYTLITLIAILCTILIYLGLRIVHIEKNNSTRPK
jgi:hypothetical protein